MRPLARHLLTLCSAKVPRHALTLIRIASIPLSLLFCTVWIAGLFGSGFNAWYGGAYDATGARQTIQVTAVGGQIRVIWMNDQRTNAAWTPNDIGFGGQLSRFQSDIFASDRKDATGLLGVVWWSRYVGEDAQGPLGVVERGEGYCLIVSAGLLALLMAILPGLWLAGAVRRRGRVVSGHCVRCGYDLRASPQRCPECGTPAETNA